MLLWIRAIMNMSIFLYFQISFILFGSELSVNGCKLEVWQPQQVFGRENQSVSVPCYINITACKSNAHEVLWYVFTRDSHHQLDPKNPPNKYQLQTQQLQINFLSTHDDGVYYCAATLNNIRDSGAQAFGNGTAVMVKELWRNTGQAVLLTLLVLLALCSLTVLTLLICIKTGRSTMLLKGRFRGTDMKSGSYRRAQFGAVVQEMYSKRNLRRNKKSSGEVSQENKVENPQSHTEKDTVYQNLNRTG